MKRWVNFLLAIVAVVLFASTPFRGTDIGKLSPVEVIWLSETEGEVYMETDVGDSGKGKSVQMALENMKRSASGTIFLETADYLILNINNEDLIEEVSALLRPSCMVCMASEIPDMEKVAAFLSAHEPELTLRQYQNNQSAIPVLWQKDGRFFWHAE